ncbi:MAG: DNA topoisomerase 3 [Candidatus Obscuribacterales bacterium]|nr:DNA topoisomerase 3 [Candidatus Obscuribacterales bacterium]
MKVVLAEKPSVARDIAAVVGATSKKDGYFEGNEYIVTYAFGHLVTLAEPEEMNPAWKGAWRLANLPMIPTEWKYRVEDKTKKQFTVIKKLFADKRIKSIVCATDAGREGELIFRLIYKLSGCKKPVERLWISSLTADAIRNGFSKLKNSKEFDSLADAATGRSHADWIVGLNLTRAYTSINRQLCTIGRVQTPTLGMIVDRQNAIDAFKPETFFEIIATFDPGFTARFLANGRGEHPTRIKDKAKAEAIFDQIKKEKHGVVRSEVTSEKVAKAPPLYDLLTLQKDANKQFGYTAQETLDIAQSLYETYKLISYPRTESRHLASDMVPELPRILSTTLKHSTTSQSVRDVFANEGIVPGKITASLLKPRLTKAYVDDGKLTDHHAIVPTYKDLPASLPQRESNVFQLVATRFMCMFLPPEIKDETVVIVDVAGHPFRARGFVVKQVGWTALEQKAKGRESEKKDDTEDNQKLPTLKKGDNVLKLKEELKEGKTVPPKSYEDGTLLTAMKNAGQEIDDEDLASYMKQKGLGTPATRAAIIERLIKTGYIHRDKKKLLPTPKGTALIGQVHRDLKNITLTASWEQRLADMQDGKLPLEKFESDIADFVRSLLPELVKQASAVVDTNSAIEPGLAPCPQCKQGQVRKTPKGAGCSRWREGCNFSVWRQCYGKTLTDGQIEELLKKGKTKVIKGFKKKDGSGSYDARLFINSEFKVRPEFD